jgi:uncharacterized protein YbbK (DUF523 family)
MNCPPVFCVPLCPEYAIGLGVPRAPAQLIQTEEGFSILVATDRTVDITNALLEYANFVSKTLPNVCGYIFKARSPSCGLLDTPVFDHHGNEIGKNRGAYAAQVIRQNTALPVIDAIQLAEPALRREFVQRVENYPRALTR